jgi:hypothetical protein
LLARGGGRQPWIRRWGSSSQRRRSSLLPALELPPLRGLPDLTWSAPHSVAAIFSSPRLPLLLCSAGPPPHQPLPHVARPTLLPFAFEERGSASLHLLSYRKAICLSFCLSCWRRRVEGTIASVRKNVLPPVVWTSLGPLPRWVPGPTTRWSPRTTRFALHDT